MSKHFDIKFWLGWAIIISLLIFIDDIGRIVIGKPDLRGCIMMGLIVLAFILSSSYILLTVIDHAKNEEFSSPLNILKDLKFALKRGTDLDPDGYSTASDAEIILILNQLDDLKEDKVELAEQSYNEAKALVKSFRPWCKMKN